MIGLPEEGGFRIQESGMRGEEGGERPNASRGGIKQFSPPPSSILKGSLLTLIIFAYHPNRGEFVSISHEKGSNLSSYYA